jgi:D-alanyl-D-alanine carboxypeptidase/D-alanyl-D-alanine-endopeptidase (penicillin-binding protein 4)
MRNLPLKTLIVATAISVGAALSQPSSAIETERSIPSELITKFENRMAAKAYTSATAAIVMDPVTGETLFSRNSKRALLPASTMKLVTAVAVLQTFGPDYRFKTPAVWDSSRKVLYIVGVGDPLLRKSQLSDLAKSIATQLNGVTGQVIVKTDVSAYSRFTAAPGWSTSQIPGEVRPVSPLVMDDRAVQDSAKLVGQTFTQFLRSSGLKATYRGNGIAVGDTLGRVSSLPLSVSVKRMLVESNNDMAEMLFRNAALLSADNVGWDQARSRALEVLRELGVPTEGVVIKDGSGLSRGNRLNAAMLGKLLLASQSPANARVHSLIQKPLLPVAGKDGTLRLRFGEKRTQCARGAVFAKTGSLRDVVSLAGYTQFGDNKSAIFAVIVNDVPRRSAQYSVRNAIDWSAAALTDC